MFGPEEKELKKRKKETEKRKEMKKIIKDSIGTLFELKRKLPIYMWP